MKFTEETIKKCSKCRRHTRHYRNNSKMGAFGWIANIALVVITGGLWLIVMLAFWLLTKKVGGWKCGRCIEG